MLGATILHMNVVSMTRTFSDVDSVSLASVLPDSLLASSFSLTGSSLEVVSSDVSDGGEIVPSSSVPNRHDNYCNICLPPN